MAMQKSKGKNNKNNVDNSDSATDLSSNGEKPLLRREDFICSTGHNIHLKEDYEPNESLLVGRRIRYRKPRIVSKQSIESSSITSFPSDLTLSSHTSTSDLLPSGIIKGNQLLQTVPEEVETRNYPRPYQSYAPPSPMLSDFDSPGTSPSSTSSSQNPTPQPNRKKIGFLGRFLSFEDANQKPVNKNVDFYEMAARNTNRNSGIIDTYEPYTYCGTPKQYKKQNSNRSRDGRLLMPRESIVHPAGPFNQPVEAYNETMSYATAYDPMSGRQRLVRRDSVIHPNGDGDRIPDYAYNRAYGSLPGRRNSIVRPLQMQRSPSLDVKVVSMTQFLPRENNVPRDVVERQREESIKRHLLNRYTPDSSTPSPTDLLPAPKYINGRFEVPWETQHKPGLFDAIKWKLTSTNRSRIPKDDELKRVLPIIKPNFKQTHENGIRVTWLGHSTVLIQMDNVVILTDPIFSDRASPLWLMGPKRYRRPPCTVSSLPAVDFVLISHNHYDHLDSESVRALNNRFGENLHWFVPLGLQDWMKHIGCQNTYEMSWWEEIRPAHIPEILVAFTPAQHWCKRALTDSNKVLWGSWCVIGPRHNFFFAGDTGYCNIFKLIGERYGPFDLAAIPIGAYEPSCKFRDHMIMPYFHLSRLHDHVVRWFMKLQNVNPFEAVLIHEDIYARQSIGIHWGTFALTSEHYLAPRKDLVEALQRRALPQHSFFTLSHGESKVVAGTTKTLL